METNLHSANNVETSKDDVSAEETSQEMYRQKNTVWLEFDLMQFITDTLNCRLHVPPVNCFCTVYTFKL